MLSELGYPSLEALVAAAIPKELLSETPLRIGEGLSEPEALAELHAMAAKNKVLRSYIGMGYSGTHTPAILMRQILQNPAWYTPYTPYQAEIAQGRLEALLNFQTMVADLAALDVANASLLDEATAAAEAMAMSHAACGRPEANLFFVADSCHSQTIAVVGTRAKALGWEVEISAHESWDFSRRPFGALVQYPKTDGGVPDYAELCRKAREAGALVTAACDILSLAFLKAPGEFGADIAVGSSQRFGVPLWFGGPHAAFLATRKEYQRLIPGRIVGVSKDAEGRRALRLALQTREQHIRRERATSNICTAQALLAVMASFYAIYHGPEGLKEIAERVHDLALDLAGGLRRLGYSVGREPFFDTVFVPMPAAAAKKAIAAALKAGMNLRLMAGGIAAALDETTRPADVRDILRLFSRAAKARPASLNGVSADNRGFPRAELRRSPLLSHPIFSSFRSETELMRYIKRLESRDFSLADSMIPLGSCTMKLNAASELSALAWPGFADVHPYAPGAQTKGYRELFRRLEGMIRDITGLAAVSFQPNAGSQGEFAGLMCIRRYHDSRGEGSRRVCLIPRSAHGTNPASAAMAGLTVVPVETAPGGEIDRADLRAKAEAHAAELACLMITYPSTHGVFEEGFRDICGSIHEAGGLVYLDGANLNALVGLCRVGEVGADAVHLNLHKTFAIPHGGGGPGMGPIAVSKRLAPFLPGAPSPARAAGAVAAASHGSAGILTIPWSYIAQMGGPGITRASMVAILGANYIAKRLSAHYPIIYRGRAGLVAHECLVDFRPFKDTAGVTVEDAAKRLMDYGFHAPTVSWPVAGSMMIEPTESESKAEIDRFVEALIAIREEIRAVEEGRADRQDNLLKNAPHTAHAVASSDWSHPYGREQAAFPLPWTRERKLWPQVARIDNAFGDRNLVCSCPPWS